MQVQQTIYFISSRRAVVHPFRGLYIGYFPKLPDHSTAHSEESVRSGRCYRFSDAAVFISETESVSFPRQRLSPRESEESRNIARKDINHSIEVK